MHCSSCLWLLEHLQRLEPAILSSVVSFERKEVTVFFDCTQTSLRKVVELLTRIGYEPHLSHDDVQKTESPDARRKHWIKIGLAGFCFSNIMMLSFPEYLAGPEGIEPQIMSVLNIIKIALSIPVITYAASEFFIKAWQGIKSRYLNIDAPIALALVITFGRSLYEIGSGTGAGYLDSMSGIVFFMLLGRWLQDLTYKAISFDRDFKSFFPIAFEIDRAGNRMQVPLEKIAAQDIIHIHHGELIPVDAFISKGDAQIDYSFVTGESIPVHVEKGSIVYAGGKQDGGKIEIIAIKEASQSYLNLLWNKKQVNESKLSAHPFIDGLSRYFTYIVFALGLIAAGYWWIQDQNALMWNAVTTILIVACPCALLLSANFTTGNILRILSVNKFYLKNAYMLEMLGKVNTVLFDKTGTLTHKQSIEITYEGKMLDEILKEDIASILIHSNHPLSKAVYLHLQVSNIKPAANFKITPGKGLEGWIHDRYIKIGSPEFTNAPGKYYPASTVCISVDTKWIGTFQILTKYRFGLQRMFASLKKNYAVALLSGDHDAEKQTLRELMGTECETRFEQRPEDKLEFIHQLQKNRGTHVLMIGDGINDVPALQASFVGIAVADGDNAFTPAADGIIEGSHISNLDHVLQYVRSGKKIILFSFIISILYNIVGLYFALQGTLSPLIAAILMPLSSLSIILITFGLSNVMAKRYHLNLNHKES